MVTTVPERVRALMTSSLARFLLAGGLTFLVDVALLAVLREVLGAPLALATALAFLGSFAFNFVAQGYFAFRPRGRVIVGLGKYGALVLVNTAATVGIVTASQALGWGWLPGKIAAVLLITTWNYFAYKYWIFRADLGSQNSTAASSHSAAAMRPESVDG